MGDLEPVGVEEDVVECALEGERIVRPLGHGLPPSQRFICGDPANRHVIELVGTLHLTHEWVHKA